MLDSACSILPEFVQNFEVIVVDDGSNDGTGDVVEEYAEGNSNVRLVRHETNKGYGGAVTSGLRNARGDYVGFMDSDGQFSLLDLPQLLCRLHNNDVVIGFRYQRAEAWPRRFNAWAWNCLIRAMLGVRVRDLDCAFKIFDRSVVDRLSLTATGACINAEIMAQCVRGNLNISEVPVAHYPRLHGDATGANFRVILRAFRELPQLWKYRESSLVLGEN
jgi:glycosyltransferase involved in cell wall biosynthesis